MTTQLNKPSKLTHGDLAGFSGTSQYYRYSPLFPWLVLTDGTRYLVEHGECYWLIDQIASLQFYPTIKNHRELKALQLWRLDVKEDKSAMLSCEWDSNKVVYTESISHTDFPLDSVRIWIAPTWLEDSGWVKVAFLPSEY